MDGGESRRCFFGTICLFFCSIGKAVAPVRFANCFCCIGNDDEEYVNSSSVSGLLDDVAEGENCPSLTDRLSIACSVISFVSLVIIRLVF